MTVTALAADDPERHTPTTVHSGQTRRLLAALAAVAAGEPWESGRDAMHWQPTEPPTTGEEPA